MDGQRFDALTKALAGGASRRGVLRAGAGGVAAAVGLRLRGARGGQEKRPLCHATGDAAHPWVVIDVAEPAWDTHFAHGDTFFVDCCANADCVAGAACVDGACTPAAACSPPCLTDPVTGQVCVQDRCVPACGGEPCVGENVTCCVGRDVAGGPATHGVCCPLQTFPDTACCYDPTGLQVTGCKDPDTNQCPA